MKIETINKCTQLMRETLLREWPRQPEIDRDNDLQEFFAELERAYGPREDGSPQPIHDD